MTDMQPIQCLGIALNAADDGGVPDWVQLTPAGPEIVGRDGRRFRMTDPAAVVARFNAANQPIIVDISHATETAERGAPVPAQGWVEEMAVRDGAIWGRVNWTKPGRALMEAQAYRYLSPVLLLAKKSGEVVGLRSAALVHRPNLEMAALNSQSDDPKETPIMDKAICDALGLAANATATDVVVAINALKNDHEVALNSAQHPDPDKFVPKADHDLALNELEELRTDAKEREAAAMNDAVDAAIAAGKIAPAAREYHLNSCQALGLAAFEKHVDGLPVLTGGKPAPKTAPAKTTTALNEEERYAMDQLGLTVEEFKAAKEN